MTKGIDWINLQHAYCTPNPDQSETAPIWLWRCFFRDGLVLETSEDIAAKFRAMYLDLAFVVTDCAIFDREYINQKDPYKKRAMAAKAKKAARMRAYRAKQKTS